MLLTQAQINGGKIIVSDKNLVTSSAENTEVEVAGYVGVTALGFFREEMDDCAGLEFPFDRIKISSGGTTAFEVSGDLEDDVEKEEKRRYITKRFTDISGMNPKENAVIGDLAIHIDTTIEQEKLLNEDIRKDSI